MLSRFGGNGTVVAVELAPGAAVGTVEADGSRVCDEAGCDPETLTTTTVPTTAARTASAAIALRFFTPGDARRLGCVRNGTRPEGYPCLPVITRRCGLIFSKEAGNVGRFDRGCGPNDDSDMYPGGTGKEAAMDHGTQDHDAGVLERSRCL